MAEKDPVHFAGISFYLIDPDTIHGYIVMRQDGQIREEKLVYKRRGTQGTGRLIAF
jgi:hypothetical protein